jgi:hypothetical protein
MVDIQTVSIAIASASVVAGVVYYSLQIRHQSLQIQQQNKMRQTDLVVRLFSTFISKEFLDAMMKFMALEFKDYKDFVNKYGQMLSESPEVKALLTIDNYFNQVGILLHRGLIDAGLAKDVFSYKVEMVWKKAEPIVQGMRKEFNLPEAVKWFEYLHNEMKKREQKLQQRGVKNG